MQLSLLEKASLESAGTVFQSIAEPASFDRDDVIYPQAMEIDADRRTIKWLVDAENPYEPLSAGFGRYMLIGTCGWLRTTPDGKRYCGTYPRRPQACQDFEEGGDNCQIMRETKVDFLPRKRAR